MSPQEGTPSLKEDEPSAGTDDEANIFSPAEYETRKQENRLKNTVILEDILEVDQNLVSHEKEGNGKEKVRGQGKGKKAAKDCKEKFGDKTNEYELFPFSIQLFTNLIFHKGSR